MVMCMIGIHINNTLNVDFGKLPNWSTKNELGLNALSIRKSIVNTSNWVQVTMNNETIQIPKSNKIINLGMWMDWSLHLTKMCGLIFGNLIFYVSEKWHVQYQGKSFSPPESLVPN